MLTPRYHPTPLFGRFSAYSIPHKRKAPGSGSENESPNTNTTAANINSTNSVAVEKAHQPRRQLQLDEDYDGDGAVEEKTKMVVMPADESGVDVKEEQAEGDGKDVDVDGDHEMVDVPSSPTTVTTAATKIDSPVAMHSPSLKAFDPPVVEEVKLVAPGAKDDSESRDMKARQTVGDVDEDAQGEGDGDAEDVEKGIIACETCGELISVRDEDKAGAFTMKYWETHQGVCNPTSVSRFFPPREGKRDPTPTFSPAISGGSTRYFGQGRFPLGEEDVGICPVLGKSRLVLG
ncbi:uncharacterized protein STEHIDRAFT_163804 [Stereum hirsutum FP-91666 SS1]|uniref:Uncharacterized protein n=1 Tax=Stereum hirsutum (strain FP-91666) TaxID=721885 RepID=R7RWS4_STEHR|nr:uncharacterized protein STEHIDRAFT_163804 [Stereum hirsutum FP-91666 SS1]EIM79280.1 hypothetical protein STEHIDRAFT_163804 [Stereum hirsutum FP-91666 SS1]